MGRNIFLLTLILFAIIQSVFSTEIPFLRKNKNGSWVIDDDALKQLKNFENKELHVVAIGGPTRTGKSFVMSHLINQFETHHFGYFVDDDTQESVTEGMNIALVEQYGRLILLIDCEGLDSLSKKMDPRLMIIMSMISQKMIYMTQDTVHQTALDDMTTMLANRDQTKMEGKDLPLNTMFTVVNKTELEDDQRNPTFFRETLHAKGQHFSDLFYEAYPNQETLYIAERFDDYTEDFDKDIENTFNKLANKPIPFAVKGNPLKVKDYLSYVQNSVLDDVNNNGKIVIKNKLDVYNEDIARGVIDEIKAKLPPCEKYYDEDFFKKDFNELIKNANDFFTEKTKDCSQYHLEQIKTEFVEMMEDYEREFKEASERFGNVIVDMRVEDDFESSTYTQSADNLDLTFEDQKCYRTITYVYANGKEESKRERCSEADMKKMIGVQQQQNMLKDIVMTALDTFGPMVAQWGMGKIMDSINKTGPNASNDPFERLHDADTTHHMEYHDLQSEGFGPQNEGQYRDLQSESFGLQNEGQYRDLQSEGYYGQSNNLNEPPVLQDLCYRGNPNDDVRLDNLVYRGDAPPQLTLVNHSNGTDSHIKNKVMELENANKVGYNAKEGKWYPHESPEGGLPTIANGIKCQSQKEADYYKNHGLTDSQATKLYDQKWNEARMKAEKHFGADTFNKATPTQQDIATELAFNKGNLKGYNNFTNKFKQGDTEGMLKENNRGFYQNGTYQPLKTRQNAIAEAARKQMTNNSLNNTSTGPKTMKL